jgi:8-oxo-dGTP pyrophosphatase MutT (NUDIX family)
VTGLSQAGGSFDRIRSRLAVARPHQVAPTAGQSQAAVAVVLVPGNPAGFDILFIKRAEYAGDPWSGHLALPGGRRHGADPDLLFTAGRETREEVGIGLSAGVLLGELDDLSPVSPHLPQIIVRPFVFGLPDRPEVIPSAEVALHVWVPRDVLAAAATTETLDLLGQARMVRGYRVGPHFIWGMTERIILSFLDLIEGVDGT